MRAVIGLGCIAFGLGILIACAIYALQEYAKK